MLLNSCNLSGANIEGVPQAKTAAPTTDGSEKEVDPLHKSPVFVSSASTTAMLENNGAVDGVIADDDYSDTDDADDVMAVAITYLEEDCRVLRVQK